MKANRRTKKDALRRAERPPEGAQLLLLAGIILVLGFITTAITLTELAGLEKEVTDDQQSPVVNEYRFFRSRVGTSLRDATTTSTDNATFHAIFESMAVTFRRMAQEKGFDFEVRLAAGGTNLAKDEWNYTSWGWQDRHDSAAPEDDHWYNAGQPVDPPGAAFDHDNDGVADDATAANPYWIYSDDDRVDFVYDTGQGERLWDGGNDGIVWVKPCLADLSAGCIQAAIVYIRMADNSAVIEEFVVYSLNS